MTSKKKRIIAIILIIISLPLAVATAVGGGGMMAYVFAALLAFGAVMLFNRSQSGKGNKLDK